MKKTAFTCLATFILMVHPSSAERKIAPLPEEIPYTLKMSPAEEVAVLAVCSKQGARVMISRDDGKTWEQSFLATEDQEDQGWHGNFAVYGMAMTEGILGVFSGWGPPGVYLGSDDGAKWGYLFKDDKRPQSIWDATAGKGVFLTSADMWRGVATSDKKYTEWESHSVKGFLDGGKTHHMICGYGDYEDGRFIVVGDERHVFYSDDLGKTWNHSRIPEEAGKGQDAIAFGNGIFLCSFPGHVARSTDGGETWELHPHGLTGKRLSWRGLNFINGEFWLTTQGGKGSRKSKDGITWIDLPDSTPGGRFAQSESGTIINVERRGKSFGIRRSEDGLEWDTVFTPPANDVTWDFSFVVSGKMKKATN